MAVKWTRLCTPGMGVNLWGVSPLYVNPINVLITLTKVLAEGKGGSVRDRLEEAGAQSDQPPMRSPGSGGDPHAVWLGAGKLKSPATRLGLEIVHQTDNLLN